MIRIFSLVSLFLCTNLLAEMSNIEMGKKIVLEGNPAGAPACMTCHMENGEGMQESGFPRLAGLSVAYIVKQLKDLQGKQRVSDVMNLIATSLSEEDIKSVAAYFSSLPTISKTEKIKSPEKFETGRFIAERGIWSKGVPACFACHGPNATGVGETFPPLTNLGRIYIIQELEAWKKGKRKNDPAMLMKSIAQKLSPKEIESVAEYLSALAPAPLEIKK